MCICGFAFGTQLWNHVADKKKEIKVWDLKYAETYTPSIVSECFIYIAVIYFELWASKNEKKAPNWSLRNVNLNFKWFVEALNPILKIWKNHKIIFLPILTIKKKSRLIRLFFQISGAFDAPYMFAFIHNLKLVVCSDTFLVA